MIQGDLVMEKLNFTSFPTIETERLILRQLDIKDVNDIFDLRTDQEVSKFLERRTINTIEQAEQFINIMNNGIKESKWIFWAIELKNESKLVGTICLWGFSEENPKAEIGYELMPYYQGKGLMQEAIESVIKYGFTALNLKSLSAYAHKDNLKSIALLERNDFVDETHEDKNNALGNDRIFGLVAKAYL